MSFKVIQQLIVLGISIGAIFLYIQPKFVEMRAIQDETTEYRNAVDNASQFNAELRSLLNQIDAISPSEEERLEDFLPAETDLVRVARDIQAIAARTAVSLESVSASNDAQEQTLTQSRQAPDYAATGEDVASSPADLLQRHEFSVSVAGGYDELKDFLSAVESNSYPMRVTSLDLQGGSAGDAAGSGLPFAYDLTIETYSLLQSV